MVHVHVHVHDEFYKPWHVLDEYTMHFGIKCVKQA